MDLSNLQGNGIELGAFGTSGVMVALLVRKAWRLISAESVATRKDGAERVLYEALRQQIEDLQHDMEKAKMAAADERCELSDRITRLDAEVSGLNYRYRTAQKNVLECYIRLRQTCPECSTATDICAILFNIVQNNQ